jgi:NAD(P)-dependent dehydrogenase (short-subunit alcohol dehydrogenase family)
MEPDVRDDAAVAAFVAHAAATFGRLDAVVNNAGRFVNGTVLRADGGQAPAVDY